MPFLKNSWYVAAWSSEVQGPTHQKIIGEDVILFRGEHGQIIALGDTCPHRFAPLHLGKVIGDLIQCPYHGLQFNAEGQCAHNPFDPSVKPAAAKVRSFPVIERDRFIWIWMGEPENANADLIPDFHWLGETDRYTMTRDATMVQDINYELIIDNLLDLSHAQFVHPTTLGNDTMATAETKTWQDGDTVYSNRMNINGPAPALFTASGAVDDGAIVDYWNDMRWDAPGAYYLEVGVTPTGEDRAKGAYFGSAHMLTPVDEHRTVYRYILFRTFARDNDAVTEGIEALVKTAFTCEDEPILAAVQARMAGRAFWSLNPVLLKGDKAAVLARRTLERLRTGVVAAE
jgi:phenylpropionate dioxygenase-like ring-hydroxylating dioxygenase large terminal subunit